MGNIHRYVWLLRLGSPAIREPKPVHSISAVKPNIPYTAALAITNSVCGIFEYFISGNYCLFP